MKERILNGWKEISSYLDRGVRTAQRWELQFGMPVHRPASRLRTAVVAFADELDEWLIRNRSRLELESRVDDDLDPTRVHELLARLKTEARDLTMRLAFLERQMLNDPLFSSSGPQPPGREEPEIFRRAS
jgi:hypothetical protein